MLSKTTLWLVALFTLCACDKSAPDSAPPDALDSSSAAAAEPEQGAVEVDAADVSPQSESEEDSLPNDEPTANDEPEGPSLVPADPAQGLSEPTSMANVKLEIKDATGKVVKDSPKVLRWDERFRIPVEIGNRMHEVHLELGQDGKAIEALLFYFVDGQEIVRNFRLELRPNKRELIHIEGGGALALTITPKTVKPKQPTTKDKVETPKGEDPLAGAER